MADTVTALGDTSTVAMQALATLATSVIDMLPSAIAAALVFVLGWLVAVLVARLLRKILEMLKVEEFLKMHKLDDALGSIRLTGVVVQVTKIYVILVFLQVALSLVALGQLSGFIYSVLLYVPVLMGAVLLVVAAALAGEYVKEKVLEVGKSHNATLVARGAKFAIVLIGVLTGLDTAGFNTSLVNSVILTIIQAAVFGLGLAFGIAFGLGGQDEARDLVKRVRKNAKF